METNDSKKIRRQEIVQGRMTWKLLEMCLKQYYRFKELVEETGIDEITLDNGVVLNFWDLLKGLDELPEKQRQAIILTCLLQMKEEDAAQWSSPCGLYKRQGLRTLVDKYWNKDGEN